MRKVRKPQINSDSLLIMTDTTKDVQIEAPIREFIASNLLYSTEGFTYADDASLLREGIIDSLGVVELVKRDGLARDGRVELDRHVDQAKRDRAAPDRSGHRRALFPLRGRAKPRRAGAKEVNLAPDRGREGVWALSCA